MTTTRTSPKAAQKQEEILEVALRVFAREGFGNTDVQIIADLANVGKGTVYRYFGNKEQLFFATAKFSLQQVTQFVRQRMGPEYQAGTLAAREGTQVVLRRVAAACAEYYQRNPQAVEIMIQERAQFRESVFPTHLVHREENRSGIDSLITQAVKSGEFRKVSVTNATNAYSDLIYGSVINGCLEGNRSTLVKRVSAAVDIFVAGLVNHDR